MSARVAILRHLTCEMSTAGKKKAQYRPLGPYNGDFHNLGINAATGLLVECTGTLLLVLALK